MKKIFIAISVALSVLSCTQSPRPGEVYNIDASLSLLQAPDQWTKSHIDFDMEPFMPVWDAKDEISLVTKRFPKGIVFTLTEGEGTLSGSFSSAVPLNDTTSNFAIYPSKAVLGSSFTDGGCFVTVEYPSQLTFNTETRCSDDCNFMAAYSGQLRSFEFKNIHCYLEIVIEGPANDAIQKVVIEGKNSEAVAGTAKVSFGSLQPTVSFDSPSQKQVTLDFGSQGLPFSSDVMDIALPPVLQGGFKLTVTSVKGSSTTVSYSSSPALEQNTILSMPEAIVVK